MADNLPVPRSSSDLARQGGPPERPEVYRVTAAPMHPAGGHAAPPATRVDARGPVQIGSIQAQNVTVNVYQAPVTINERHEHVTNITRVEHNQLDIRQSRREDVELHLSRSDHREDHRTAVMPVRVDISPIDVADRAMGCLLAGAVSLVLLFLAAAVAWRVIFPARMEIVHDVHVRTEQVDQGRAPREASAAEEPRSFVDYYSRPGR